MESSSPEHSFGTTLGSPKGPESKYKLEGGGGGVERVGVGTLRMDQYYHTLSVDTTIMIPKNALILVNELWSISRYDKLTATVQPVKYTLNCTFKWL